MNANLRRLGLAFTIVFALISVDLVYWQVFDAGSLNDNVHNPRALVTSERVLRGKFFDRNGGLLVGRWRKPDGYVQPIYHDQSLAQTIGYHSIEYSDSGLQASLNPYLIGQAGTNWTQTYNSWLHRPVTGDNVYLTIDERVQAAAVAAIKNVLAAPEYPGLPLDPNTPVAAVAFNPTNGQILAMVSKPYYDPTCLGNEASASEARCWGRINQIPGVPYVEASPLVNRVTNDTFPPGSTFKTVTLSGALDAGTQSLSDLFTGNKATGPLVIDGYTLTPGTSNLPPGATSATLLQAFMWSDNIVYAQVGVKLGWPRFLHYAHGFMIGRSIPFDLPVTPSTILSPGERRDPVSLATSAFGQGSDVVTPMQMMLIAGAIANNGKIALPILVKAIKTPGGTTVRSDTSRTVPTAISPSTAHKVRYAMEQEVSGYYGSGYQAKIPGILVAGKTGTAQTDTPVLDTWFISFAPANHPLVACAVVVQGGIEGAYTAAPIARQIMQAAIQYGE